MGSTSLPACSKEPRNCENNSEWKPRRKPRRTPATRCSANYKKAKEAGHAVQTPPPVRWSDIGNAYHSACRVEVCAFRKELEKLARQWQTPEYRKSYHRRDKIVEPRFARLKQALGFRRWSYFGLSKVKAQWSMLCATLNLKEIHRKWTQQGGTFFNNPSPGAKSCAMPASASAA